MDKDYMKKKKEKKKKKGEATPDELASMNGKENDK